MEMQSEKDQHRCQKMFGKSKTCLRRDQGGKTTTGNKAHGCKQPIQESYISQSVQSSIAAKELTCLMQLKLIDNDQWPIGSF